MFNFRYKMKQFFNYLKEDNQKIIEFLEKNDEIPKINYYKQKEFLKNQKNLMRR